MSKNTPVQKILIIGSEDELRYISEICGKFVCEQESTAITIKTGREVHRSVQKIYFTQAGFEHIASTCKSRAKKPWGESKVKIQKKCVTNLADALYERCAKTVEEVVIWFYNGNQENGKLHHLVLTPRNNVAEEILAA